jgi:nitrogenase molybdenum-iron protein alpha/beta subunit/MoaA/NifB/PqqE/SkfB family radical SAM enzyme
MSGNLVNLNVNPCKMCMPMGAVSALCGIRGCMSILHGSQGCATYIRRHAATHYNEPVDIASSSLTEEGTVFGGEENLLKGLRNMIDLYAPEVIGVCTTCLAETIGEDVGAVVRKFYAQNPDDVGVKIITVASPGYGGTQNEGWFAAIRAVLEQTVPNEEPNGRINVFTPMISPADVRYLKSTLKSFFPGKGTECVILPDISENLDGATEKRYNRLKTEGTSIESIAAMSGARLTIEFSEFTDARNSPAEYLSETFGVPFVKLPLPVGVRGMDMLVSTLIDAGGKANAGVMKARGRCLDAMADSHKHCAEARAAVYGDPDFTVAMVRLCCENGILPVVAATGSVSPKLRETLTSEAKECAEYHFEECIDILDDSDFAAIEEVCRKRGANLLIGSSDGRRIARSMNIPLIRCAFPIHDYVGGQRVRILGFDGTLNILDQAANAMIERTESTFRSSLYGELYAPKDAAKENVISTDTVSADVVNTDIVDADDAVSTNTVSIDTVTADTADTIDSDDTDDTTDTIDTDDTVSANTDNIDTVDTVDIVSASIICTDKVNTDNAVSADVISIDTVNTDNVVSANTIIANMINTDTVNTNDTSATDWDSILDKIDVNVDGVDIVIVDDDDVNAEVVNTNTVNTDTVNTDNNDDADDTVNNTVNTNDAVSANVISKDTVDVNAEKTASHPCFGEHACQNARVHLPVAPECNIQCNYCLRNYDCMNESRPGVASKILSPTEAFERYVKLKETMPNLTVAGIAGPGDALANFDLTRETFRLIREHDKDVTFCIATNGLLLPQYVSQLRELGVSHVTVTINAVDPAIGAKIYRHVSYMGKTYEGIEGATILLANQLAGIKMLADAGIVCKVNCVTLKGINDNHILDVVKTVSELGVFMANIMPHIPVKGSVFEGLDRVNNMEIAALRKDCGAYVKQMSHCRQCRSDAAGTLDDDRSVDFYNGEETKAAPGKLMRFAVATKSGAIVDMHFGHVSEFYIYESDASNTRFVETRKVGKYCNGPECNVKNDKWEPIIRAVADCVAVLAMRIGPTPEKRLKEKGIDAIMTYDRVETAVARAAKERSAVHGIA